MIVAVVAVGVVQMAIHQVIYVIAMGHCLVAAVAPMSVRLLMSVTLVAWRASFRIRRVHLDPMIVHVIAV
jgi:hypothetical protein